MFQVFATMKRIQEMMLLNFVHDCLTNRSSAIFQRWSGTFVIFAIFGWHFCNLPFKKKGSIQSNAKHLGSRIMRDVLLAVLSRKEIRILSRHNASRTET